MFGGFTFPLRAVTGCFHRVAGVATKCEPLAWPGLSGNRFIGNVIFQLCTAHNLLFKNVQFPIFFNKASSAY